MYLKQLSCNQKNCMLANNIMGLLFFFFSIIADQIVNLIKTIVCNAVKVCEKFNIFI